MTNTISTLQDIDLTIAQWSPTVLLAAGAFFAGMTTLLMY